MTVCISCGERPSATVGTNPLLGALILQCATCRLAFTAADAATSRARLQMIYREMYWHPAHGAAGTPATQLAGVVTRTVRRLGVPSSRMIAHDRLLQRHASGRLLLEVGAGHGHALRYFRARGYDIRGIEADEQHCRTINRRNGADVCLAGDVETMDISGSFDVIYMSHVLEHLIDPLRFLERIRLRLLHGGVILIEVPNCENGDVMRSSVRDGSHLYHFSPTAMSRLVARAGYRTLCLDTCRHRSRTAVVRLLRQILRTNDYERVPTALGHTIVLIAQRFQ